MKKASLLLIIVLVLATSCSKTTTSSSSNSTYTGTASVSQGKGTTTTSNLFPSGQRVASLGTINSTDGKSWALPAEVNYTSSTFPFASDLYNSYVSGHSYSSATNALAGLSGNDIITVDAAGEVYTAYIFADNYFEMYINGVPVGKDAVPYTDFNSSIVRFKVSKPFNIAVKCVDWEENLGLGTEAQGASSNYVGDGGFVAVIKNSAGTEVATTNNTWKAQTFYIAPITDLACPTESGNYRYSSNCATTSASTSSYGLHWAIPSNWYTSSFDDSNWPNATLFSNATVGVDNKPSYTNFTDIFDNASNDASFIWSTNLLLDNVVLLRKKIE